MLTPKHQKQSKSEQDLRPTPTLSEKFAQQDKRDKIILNKQVKDPRHSKPGVNFSPNQKSTLTYITPLTKLGELESELIHNCALMSKTEVQVKDEIKTCQFHEGFTKKVQVMLLIKILHEIVTD